MDIQPLVSVIVLSYNAQNLITETLQSIYEQDYKRIELVISDDASTDNTVEVFKGWIKDKADRFESVVINVMDKNGGVPANLNSGIKCCNGEYIKIIAADDLLLSDCISTNVGYCEEKGYDCLVTWLKKFSDSDNGRKIWDEAPNQDFFNATAQQQYEMLLEKNYVYGCLFFAKKEYIAKMGMYNEKYRLIEDYPMWLKITSSGDKLNFLNVPTVLYRISESSLSNSVGRTVVNKNFSRCHSVFVKEQIIPALINKRKIIPLIKHLRIMFYQSVIIAFGNDRRKPIVRFLDFFYMRKYLKRNRN